jgi:acetyl esterase
MTLHPDCVEALRIQDGWELPAEPSLEQVRAFVRRQADELGGPRPPLADVRELTVDGPGGPVPVRVYRPHAAPGAGVLVWLHGGSFVAGSLDGSEDQARALALASGCTVVAVDYRLAPEHRFPAGLEDCYATVAWAAGRPAELGDVGPGLAVGGESAGGTLAAAVTLLAREHGAPAIDFQLIVYPRMTRALDTASRHAYGESNGWSLSRIDARPDPYEARPEDAVDPLRWPLLAPSLAGLPPALVVTAEHDPLRDDGHCYAGRLLAAGVPVEVRDHAGMIHGFIGYGRVVRQAAEALAHAGGAVREALERATALVS